MYDKGLQQIAISNNINVSLGIINTRLHDNNISFKKPIYKPLLTEKHKQIRLE